MAVFQAQISAQVPQAQKDKINDMLTRDRAVVASTSEADVIRLAIEVGARLLCEREPDWRVQLYALQRRGLSVEEDLDGAFSPVR